LHSQDKTQHEPAKDKMQSASNPKSQMSTYLVSFYKLFI
jgi:hypothetical protein